MRSHIDNYGEAGHGKNETQPVCAFHLNELIVSPSVLHYVGIVKGPFQRKQCAPKNNAR